MKYTELETCIEEFIKDKNKKGAFFVDGEWGIGKTTLVKNILRKLDNEDKAYTHKNKKYIKNKVFEKWNVGCLIKHPLDAAYKYRHKNAIREYNFLIKKRKIYISLNGITTTDQLNKELYAKLHPGHSFFKSTLNKVGDMDISISVPYVGFSVKPMVLDSKIKQVPGFVIFDDLERCLIDLREIFGYFSKLIDESGLKLIIVGHSLKIEEYSFSDENFKQKLISALLLKQLGGEKKVENIGEKLKNISKQIFDSNHFSAIKEKVITDERQLTFDEEVFDTILNEHKNADILIKANRDFIKNSLICSNCKNFRLLNSILVLIDEAIKKKIINNGSDEYSTIFLKNVLYNEIQNYKESLNLKDNSIYDELYFDEDDYLESARKFILIHDVNSDLVRNEKKIIENKKSYEIVNILSQDWKSKNDTDIIKLITKLLQDLDEKIIPTNKLYSSYFFLSKYEEYGFDMCNINLENIVEKIINQIKTEKVFVDTTYFSLIINTDDLSDTHKNNLKRISNAYDEINDQLKEDTIKTLVKDNNKLLNLSIKDVQKIADLAISRKKFAALLNINDLKKIIREGDNDIVYSLLDIFRKVYHFSNLNDFFKDDLDSLINIKNVIENEIDYFQNNLKGNVIKTRILHDINSFLNNTIESIKK